LLSVLTATHLLSNYIDCQISTASRRHAID
jgi:hypothetical protein